MTRGRFLRLVRQALAEVPAPYSEWLANVDVVVERRPGRFGVIIAA